MPAARLTGLSMAALAAVLWAVGATVLQPLTEPVGPWPEALAENNTYWARDLRFAAIVAVVAGLVLAGRGQRGWTAPAVVLGGLWAAADVAVDRVDPTGAGATVLLAAAGCAAVAAAALLGVRAPRRTRPDGSPAAPGHAGVADGPVGTPGRAGAADAGRDRRVLVGAACVTAVLTLVAAAITSPTDREPELNPAAVGTALLLLALTVGCALAAAPEPTRARLLLAAGLAVLGAAGVGLARLAPPGQRIPLVALLGAVLLTGVTLVAWDWPQGRPAWPRHAAVALAAAVGPYAVLLVVTVLTMGFGIGAAFTRLAGNPAIHSADSDVLYSLAGVVAGLAMAGLLTWAPALGGPPPYRADPRGPVGPDDSSRPASFERR